MTVVVAVVAYLFVWDEPSTATFLSDEEKSILLEALNYTPTELSTSAQLGNEHSFEWRHVTAAILDWQVCLPPVGFETARF